MAFFIPSPKTLGAAVLTIVALGGTSLLVGCDSGGNNASSPPESIPSSDGQQGASTAAGIRLNQLGFLPAATKWALVPAVKASRFSVIDVASGVEVFGGDLTGTTNWEPADEVVKLADFSQLTRAGEYQLRVTGVTDSRPFRIADDVYAALNAASIKAFYFNRNSAELLPEHAGIFARPLGHPDTHVLVHASAASAERPEGTVISSPKGWYDAGDYNKYIVNSGISTYSLLAAYEHFPAFFDAQNLTIPESGDAIPDLLNEALWNLEWMLTMQDPADGGVYHKLTNKKFDGTVMPHEATTERYVVQKTTTAALDFAAVMATASRVLAKYETELPGLSARMLAAAESAWLWAQANSEVVYQQPDDIKTGEYGDRQLADEFFWAAAELYITTKNDSYYMAANAADTSATVPSWGDVRSLGWISLAHHREQLSAVADQELIAKRIETLASELVSVWSSSAYRVTMQTEDFIWGSNSVALGQGMMLLQAYRLTDKREYLDAAQSTLDYVLGRNAVDMSFVTGFGHTSTLHPHHRPAGADGIDEPIPGFIAGGPQPRQQDNDDCPVAYPSSIPAKSYLDHYCSYASNEVAINWNAPLVYVSAALQVLIQ
jgi:endoglucanase